MMNDWILSKHVEQTKNCGIKTDYKNCATRWLFTYYNSMHGTYNVKTPLVLITVRGWVDPRVTERPQELSQLKIPKTRYIPAVAQRLSQLRATA